MKLFNNKYLDKSLLLLLVVAIIFRLLHLNGSFWLDEAAQALESARPFSEQLKIVGDFQPPLLHLILHFAMYFSHSEWYLRVVAAVIPSLVSLIAIYLLAKRIFDKQTAIISTILLSSSSFHIFFSQELRPYSLSAMWVALSNYFLYCLLTNPKSKSKKLRKWLVIIVFNALGLYSTYLFPFVLITQLITVSIMYRQHLKEFIKSLLLSLILFLPWLPSFYHQLQAGQYLRQQLPGWEKIVSYSQLQAIPLTLGKFFFGVVRLESNLQFLSLASLLVVLSGILSFYLFKKIKIKQKSWLFIFFSIALPLLFSWLVSFWIPIIQPKRVMFVQPMVFLLLSALATQGWKLKKLIIGFTSIALIGTMLTLNIFGYYQYATQKTLQREDWRSLVNNLKTRFPSDSSIVIFSFGSPFAPWQWYASNHFQTHSTGYLLKSSIDETQENLKIINDYQFVILFDYLRDLSDPNNLLQQAIESYGYEEIEIIDTTNIGFVRVYIKDRQLLMGYLE